MTNTKPTMTPAANSSFDTGPGADAAQLRVLQQMAPEQRSLLAARFSEDIRNTTLAGIRSRHSELDERQVLREFARLTIEPELFEKAYGKFGSEP